MRVNSKNQPESHNNANAMVRTRGRDAKSIRLPSPAASTGLSPPVDLTRQVYTAWERQTYTGNDGARCSWPDAQILVRARRGQVARAVQRAALRPSNRGVRV